MLDFLWGMFLLCNSEKLSLKSHHITVFWYIAHYLRNKFFRDFSDTMLGGSIFFCSLATIKVSYSEFCVSKPVEAFISLIVVWSFQLLFNKKQYKITMVNDYLPIAQRCMSSIGTTIKHLLSPYGVHGEKCSSIRLLDTLSQINRVIWDRQINIQTDIHKYLYRFITLHTYKNIYKYLI